MGETETLGQRVRRLRRDRGMSTDALARVTGVSKGQIARVESGETSYLLPDTLERYERALGVPARYIATGDMPGADGHVTPELLTAWSALHEPGKRALLSVARTLAEMQAEMQAEYTRPDTRQVAEGGEPTPLYRQQERERRVLIDTPGEYERDGEPAVPDDMSLEDEDEAFPLQPKAAHPEAMPEVPDDSG